MPDMNEFRNNFALWEWMLVYIENRPKSDMEEIRKVVRSAWESPDLRDLWITFVAEKAKEAQGLRDMAKGITDRLQAISKTDSQS